MYALLLFLLFTLVPALETWGIIEIGRVFGGWQTVAWLLLAGITGAWLGRRAGFRVLTDLRAELSSGRSPANQLVEGVLVLAGSLLLVTPGLLTDVVGLLLFVGPLRRWLAPRVKAWALRRFALRAVRVGPLGSPGPTGPTYNPGGQPVSPTPFDHPIA